MKKGFTLVEVIAVIVILGVIAIIAFPAIDTTLKDSRQKAYQENITRIENAAARYSLNHDLGDIEEYQAIQLNDLKTAGLLTSEDIINPVDDSVMNGCVLYRWVVETKQYEFKYDETCTVQE